MKKSPVKMLFVMLFLMAGVFAFDLFIPNSIISIFYILIVLFSHWIDDEWLAIGATIFSIILTLIAYFVINTDFTLISLCNKLLMSFIIMAVSFLVTKGKATAAELKRTNETLELRVLARTAAAEAKSKRLEQQIRILQAIRKEEKDSAFSKLDEVILTLKELSSEKETN